MATKEEVADYINNNYESVWTAEEEAEWDAREAAKKAPEPTVELGSEEEFDMTFIPDQ